MKKILATALICATLTFAQWDDWDDWDDFDIGDLGGIGGQAGITKLKTWDYFPTKEAGKGEARLGYELRFPMEKVTQMGLEVDARFTVIEGLEVAAFLSFPISESYDGTSNDDYAGMAEPVIGVRYWMPSGLGIFASFQLPFSSYDGDADMAIYPGVQYSLDAGDIKIGSELGVVIPFENGDTKVKNGMDLAVGVAGKYGALGSVTPFVIVDLVFGLTKPQIDGNDAGDAPGIGIFPRIGAEYAINDAMSAEAYFGLGFGAEERVGEDMPMAIGARFSMSF